MIIVTGAAGFIGYQTVRALENSPLYGPSQVISVDKFAFFDRPEHKKGPTAARYEIQVSPNEMTSSFFQDHAAQGKPIKGIIHLGACTDTTEMRVDYLKKVNLEYSQNLWELATKFKVPFIYASSAATYGGGELGYEDDESKMAQLKPLNPYGESKRLFDLWVMEQEKLNQTPPAWSGFKFFNVYGFGERHKEKMSSVVLQGFDQILKTGKLKLFKSHKAGIADGEQKRDFIFVDDVVSVLLHALQRPIKRGIYNLGSGKARSFKDLALATFHALGKEPKIEFIDTPIEIRDRYQYFTEAKMNKLKAEGYSRDFAPLEVGVRRTVDALIQQGHES